jgi:hypothetical protein
LLLRKINWLNQADNLLEGIKYRAAKKLAEINAKQAKEYQELFQPTCSQPDPEPEPDLNIEIMQELAKFQVERSSVDQFAFGETHEEVYDATSAFSKGPMAKNPLGPRGVDAVQVSSHRGPPTDRPPDRPDRGRSVYGGCPLESASTQSPVCHLASSLSLP